MPRGGYVIASIANIRFIGTVEGSCIVGNILASQIFSKRIVVNIILRPTASNEELTVTITHQNHAHQN